jgi:hypothetical protein
MRDPHSFCQSAFYNRYIRETSLNEIGTILYAHPISLADSQPPLFIHSTLPARQSSTNLSIYPSVNTLRSLIIQHCSVNEQPPPDNRRFDQSILPQYAQILKQSVFPGKSTIDNERTFCRCLRDPSRRQHSGNVLVQSY